MRAALLAAVVLIGGCDCGKKKSAAPATGSSAPERDVPTTTRKDPPKRPGIPRDVAKESIRRSATITVEEAQAAVPALEGARAMGATAVSPKGTQARSTYCMDAESVEAANASVVAQLEAAGWKRLTTRPPDDDPLSGFATAGERGPLRISANVSAARRTGCDATVNQFFVTIGVNKIASD